MENLNLLDYKNTILIPFLLSVHGAGKTQFVQDYAKNNNMNCFTLNLCSVEACDFTGIPNIIDGVTVYAIPKLFTLKNTIIFLDEVNRVTDPDIKAVLHSFFVDRAVNGHILDESNIIVCAGNPSNGDLAEQYDTIDLDASLADRLVNINFGYTFKQFTTYLRDKIGSIPFINFIESNESVFDDISRRRIFETCKMVKATKKDNYIKSFLDSGIFALYNEFNSKRLMGLDQILNGDKISKDAVGVQAVIPDLLKYMINSFDAKKADNINKFLTGLQAESKMLFFQGLKESEITKEHIDVFLESNVFNRLGKYLKELY